MDFKKIKSIYGVAFVLVLTFAMFGCQTATDTIKQESSVASLPSTSVHIETKKPETIKPETEPVKKEKAAAEKSHLVKESEVMEKESSVDAPEKSSETQKRSLEDIERQLFDRWLGVMGHGGAPRLDSSENPAEKSSEDTAGQSEKRETRAFPELEEKVIGKWQNEKETESMEFFNDKTIHIGNEEGSHKIIKGNFRFVDEEHLAVDFSKRIYRIPSMSFQITVSENELILTGEEDGVPTTYKRVK